MSTPERDVEQSAEYLWLDKISQRYPRFAKTVLALFSIDLRTLALTRIVLAILVLAELTSRIGDLRAFFSDDGVTPRAAIQEQLQHSWFVSLHFLSGRTEIEALMLAVGGVFALSLLVGFNTRLASFLTWLLYSSLCVRNPFVIHGGDSLLKMLLFWGMFVPWGARYSVDSAGNPESNRLPQRVFSSGTIALLLQMPIVYFFSGVLKNGLEWRHDFTAIEYALRAPDFALPLGVWLTSHHLWLRVLTPSILVLEMAGAILLFVPIHTKRIRFLVICAFTLLQLGLALTLKLGLFPAISTAGLLPFISSAFWDRTLAKLSTTERSSVRIFYDADCGFCRCVLRIIKTFFLLPVTQISPGHHYEVIQEEIRRANSWVVIDAHGNKHFKFDALLEVFRISPILWPLVPLLSWNGARKVGTWFYERVAANRGRLTRLWTGCRPGRVTLRQPLLVTLLCAFCLVYVIIDGFGSVARSPVRIPTRIAGIGQLLNIHQHWRMFAPGPLRAYTWYVVSGRLADGREIDLWTGREPVWSKSQENPAWVTNNRWRTYMRLLANDKQESLRPYFVNYVCGDWNKQHHDTDAATDVSFYRLDEPLSLDGSPPQVQKTLLFQQVCTVRP